MNKESFTHKAAELRRLGHWDAYVSLLQTPKANALAVFLEILHLIDAYQDLDYERDAPDFDQILPLMDGKIDTDCFYFALEDNNIVLQALLRVRPQYGVHFYSTSTMHMPHLIKMLAPASVESRMTWIYRAEATFRQICFLLPPHEHYVDLHKFYQIQQFADTTLYGLSGLFSHPEMKKQFLNIFNLKRVDINKCQQYYARNGVSQHELMARIPTAL